MTVPLSVSSNLATILSRELFPAPLTPISPAFSPGATVNDTSSNTSRGPYESEMLLTCNIANISFDPCRIFSIFCIQRNLSANPRLGQPCHSERSEESCLVVALLGHGCKGQPCHSERSEESVGAKDHDGHTLVHRL